MSIDIITVLDKMYMYQKEHNITGQCITNTQFIYNYITTNFNDNSYRLRTKTVIVVADISEKYRIICCNHIIIELNGVNIDPSYEYYNKPNIVYYSNYDEFFLTGFCRGYKCEYTKSKHINNYLKMLKISTQINITGKITKYINHSYYDELELLFNQK